MIRTPLCERGLEQTIQHVVFSRLRTKFEGNIEHLHNIEADAKIWLENLTIRLWCSTPCFLLFVVNFVVTYFLLNFTSSIYSWDLDLVGVIVFCQFSFCNLSRIRMSYAIIKKTPFNFLFYTGPSFAIWTLYLPMMRFRFLIDFSQHQVNIETRSTHKPLVAGSSEAGRRAF